MWMHKIKCLGILFSHEISLISVYNHLQSICEKETCE